jgi:hypothetical protein
MALKRAYHPIFNRYLFKLYFLGSSLLDQQLHVRTQPVKQDENAHPSISEF